ncbi:MAG: hypothetical protein V8T46_06465 [Sutterella seckii]
MNRPPGGSRHRQRIGRPRKARTTGIPSETIVRVARAFFTQGGVGDDGWYASSNGNDTHAFALL